MSHRKSRPPRLEFKANRASLAVLGSAAGIAILAWMQATQAGPAGQPSELPAGQAADPQAPHGGMEKKKSRIYEVGRKEVVKVGPRGLPMSVVEIHSGQATIKVGTEEYFCSSTGGLISAEPAGYGCAVTYLGVGRRTSDKVTIARLRVSCIDPF